ncbi:hypothetical protein [Rhizobium sp. GN54]|uniref:hypothetical protein n=1 Tax=Rhizobium sp. GN54 TaxID=2898150 RepID=UPI001E5FD2E1|nr:hypothetical protein [Rhizobium sp. GN54]MCD2184670.1 hypothetical protein [Rhizobium sp. GN54]
MSCFCTVPADSARNRFNWGIMPVLPTAPLTMKLALAIPGMQPASRLDMKIASGFQPETLPNLDFGGGPLGQIAMMLSLMSGTFALDDLPKLEMQMEQAANSIARNVWPRLGWLTTLKMQPLVNYALVARLVLDLQALGIDPFVVDTFPASSSTIPNFGFALSPLKLRMAKIVAGLPTIMQMSEMLDLPPLGDPGAVSALNNRLQGMASLAPPSLIIPMPLLMKLAMVLESLAKIEEAFGPDAFSPAKLGRIETMLSMWRGFQLPFPTPELALALNAKLDLLPTMEDIRLGEAVAGQTAGAFAANFAPPKLAIGPFLNMVLALHASLQFAIDMEPFDMCGSCSC